ncbi:coadhesin-like [Mercenaria mercenaria]|uniref:coadhesin-like n=1 Tax=Mercenaria mercenaria TaxID=6596 RepID=UPI00234EC082|nr:coadhesin-like [Mercenaria mercenaria]
MNTLIDLCKDIHHAKNICPKFCGLCSLVDGNWSGWTTWGTCDVTCSNGTRIRTRICSNPAPQNSGLDCQGQNTDQKSCFKDVCPTQGGWSTWSDWSTCSATCDVGISRRERSCSNPYPSKFGDHCFGLNVDDRLCMPGQCADGGWTSWETWGVCSVTCGLGIRSRARWCRNPEPSPYGRDCQGVPQEVETCHDRNCKTMTDCYDIINYDRMATSGIYDIITWKTHSPISVYCDMTTDGGRWTVFQYRFNGSEDFFRNFSDYENGFGKLDGEFWLGLMYIQELADQGDTELRVDLEAANGDKAYETLVHFSLSARPPYTLHVGSVIKSQGSRFLILYEKKKQQQRQKVMTM